MMRLLFIGLFLSFSQVWAFSVTAPLDGADDCLSDSLECDFTDQELRQALGLRDYEPIDEELLYPHVVGLEDGELDGAFFEYISDKMPMDKAPIWKSFISNFKVCAPGCIPANFGTYGKRRNRSCHPAGRAVDVGAIICGGKKHLAIKGGKFTKFVNCMKGRMKTLYRNGKGITTGHHDHAHFSNGCVSRGRKTY